MKLVLIVISNIPIPNYLCLFFTLKFTMQCLNILNLKFNHDEPYFI